MNQVNASWNLCALRVPSFFIFTLNRWFKHSVQETRIYQLLDNSSPSNHQRKTWKTRISPSGTLEVSVLVFQQHLWNHNSQTRLIYFWQSALRRRHTSHAVTVYASSSSKLRKPHWKVVLYTWQLTTVQEYKKEMAPSINSSFIERKLFVNWSLFMTENN